MLDTLLILPHIADGEDKSSILANRIRKNYRHLRKWAKRTSTDCFRIYDREIPNYPLAIDFYAGSFSVHYFSQGKGEEEPPEKLVEAVTYALETVFGPCSASIYWRTRMRSKKTRQYEKQGERGEFFTVHEYGIRFKVNLVDYLDMGLFLDHRETRKFVASLAKDKKVLNLFAYTCAFSVHAAMAGASYTKSVDMSNTYTEWGKENFALNHLSLRNHEIIREDCIKFLSEEVRSPNRYDLIIIDPPTISRSKKMEGLFDIQVDYIFLLEKSLKLLSKNGVIIFSTNSRKFVFDLDYFSQCTIEEMTHKTIPVDFRDTKIHRCWKLQHWI